MSKTYVNMLLCCFALNMQIMARCSEVYVHGGEAAMHIGRAGNEQCALYIAMLCNAA